MKELAKQEPQALVSLLLPGAVFLGTIDKELRGRKVEADQLFRVIWHGVEIILHVEFQRKADKNMAHRTWEYNVMTRCVEPYPVYSVVIYLTKEDGIVESPYILEEVPGEPAHVFFFRNLKLWEIPLEVFKREGSEGLLALLPLTEGGNNREVVEEMIAELKARNRTDLLLLGWAFAGLVLKQGADVEWLRERFNEMEDLFQDSPVYQLIAQEKLEKGLEQGLEKGLKLGLQQGLQQGLEKGLEQGLQQGLQQVRQMLVRRVQKHFPVLAPLAQEQAALIEDLEVLNNTIDAIIDAETVEEARHVLEEAHQGQ